MARGCPILNLDALEFEKGILGSQREAEALLKDCQLRQLWHGCRPQGRYRELRAQERLQGLRRKQQGQRGNDKALRACGGKELKVASISSEGHLSLGWQWSTVPGTQTHTHTCQSL